MLNYSNINFKFNIIAKKITFFSYLDIVTRFYKLKNN